MLSSTDRRICHTVLRRAAGFCFHNRFLPYSICSQSNDFSTFVSKHYDFNPAELKNVIDSMHTETRQKDDGQIEVKECKLCNKRNRSNADNIWKLTVRPNGSYYCYRCAASGSWYDLKKKSAQKFGYASAGDCLNSPGGEEVPEEPIEGAEEVTAKKTTIVKKTGKSTVVIENNEKKYVLPNQKTVIGDHHRLFPPENEPDTQDSTILANRATVLDYLNNVRGINSETLKRYGVGFNTQQFLSDDNGEWQDQLCISFPWMVSEEDHSSCSGGGGGSKKKKPSKAGSTDEDSDASTAAIAGKDGVSQLSIDGVKCVVVRSKYRALATKGLQRIGPKGGQWGFFGWHLTGSNSSSTCNHSSAGAYGSIIITEGEYDAMAVAQALADLKATSSDNADDGLSSVPVVSLPNGCNSLPVELVALLEPFTKIYLWMDNDKSGIDACEKFVKKLGVLRCVVVRPDASDKNPPKDANDALRREGGSALVVSLLRKAKLMKHSKIQTFADLKDEVFAAIRRVDMREGTQTQSLKRLCQICKGFRKGSGKTTLLSQLSLDFAKEGAATLWGSFEIKNNRLLHKMLQQSYKHGALNLLNDTKLNQVANDFEALPLQFMNFHGSTAMDEIIDAMDYAVYKDDIQHIIIDNLQFMMPRGVVRGNYDKFDYQDSVIDKFRRFATEKNVNVILVIHPRKEDDAVPLGMSSIFGSAKATQEADLVLLLQRSSDAKMSLDIKKNRYDGTLGKIQLDYNPTSLCYIESEREEASNSGKKKIG